MSKLAWIALVGLAVALSADFSSAAPDRKPAGKSDGEPLPAIPLDQLPKEGAVLFGDWLVGRNIDEQGLIIIHRQSKLAIYLPWASNGWVNYRTGDGTSYVLWPKGGSDPQPRNYYLEKFAAPPPGRLAAGKHTFQNWTVTVSNEVIEFQCSSMKDCMTVRRNALDFTHNGRTIGNGK